VAPFLSTTNCGAATVGVVYCGWHPFAEASDAQQKNMTTVDQISIESFSDASPKRNGTLLLLLPFPLHSRCKHASWN
jgi:hypothetical protein